MTNMELMALSLGVPIDVGSVRIGAVHFYFTFLPR